MAKVNRKLIRLQGLSFAEELLGESLDFRNKTIYVSLVPWEVCNWSCRYCHESRRFREEGELNVSECRSIVKDAGVLGIRSLLLLGGEVILDRVWEQTQEIVQTSYDAGLITIIYTNGSQLTQERAEWLSQRKVSLALKVDSLIDDRYDKLTGRKGSYLQTMRAIEIAQNTSIGEVVVENDREKLVRLLFTTVGNSANVDEYVSLAKFATNHGARWMMEALNHRGEIAMHPQLRLDQHSHSEAMRYAMLLNPEQNHFFSEPCRLLSCITIRKKGEVGICPQDYDFRANIRNLGSLKQAINIVRDRVTDRNWRESWTGVCPIKISASKFLNLESRSKSDSARLHGTISV